jgi:hypothetical protein
MDIVSGKRISVIPQAEINRRRIMKKILVLLLIVGLGVLLCTACVTKNDNNTLERGRNAAVDATRRMNGALGN